MWSRIASSCPLLTVCNRGLQVVTCYLLCAIEDRKQTPVTYSVKSRTASSYLLLSYSVQSRTASSYLVTMCQNKIVKCDQVHHTAFEDCKQLPMRYVDSSLPVIEDCMELLTSYIEYSHNNIYSARSRTTSSCLLCQQVPWVRLWILFCQQSCCFRVFFLRVYTRCDRGPWVLIKEVPEQVRFWVNMH